MSKKCFARDCVELALPNSLYCATHANKLHAKQAQEQLQQQQQQQQQQQ